MTFEEWWSGQHGDPYEIGFMQACKIAFEAGSRFEQEKAELAMEGADEAFGHIVDEKKDLQKNANVCKNYWIRHMRKYGKCTNHLTAEITGAL